MVNLSIVIVNMNTKEDLKGCLESIIKNVKNVKKLKCEIIVVDNNSIDNSCRMLESEFPEVKLIKNRENIGYSQANNQGIRLSMGRYVLILNPDTVILPNLVEQMYEFLQRNQKAGACGPKILDQTLVPFKPMLYMPSFRKILCDDNFLKKFFPRRCDPQYPIPQRVKKVERLSGCCLFFRRETLNSVGLFNEAFFLYYEEADIFYRVKRKGWDVYYLPEASIIHKQGTSSTYLSHTEKVVINRKSSFIFLRTKYGHLITFFIQILLLWSYLCEIMFWYLVDILPQATASSKQKINLYLRLFTLTLKDLFHLRITKTGL